MSLLLGKILSWKTKYKSLAKKGILYTDIAKEFNITDHYAGQIARNNGIKRKNLHANYNS
jgi:hypothetical protein